MKFNMKLSSQPEKGAPRTRVVIRGSTRSPTAHTMSAGMTDDRYVDEGEISSYLKSSSSYPYILYISATIGKQ